MEEELPTCKGLQFKEALRKPLKEPLKELVMGLSLNLHPKGPGYCFGEYMTIQYLDPLGFFYLETLSPYRAL